MPNAHIQIFIQHNFRLARLFCKIVTTLLKFIMNWMLFRNFERVTQPLKTIYIDKNYILRNINDMQKLHIKIFISQKFILFSFLIVMKIKFWILLPCNWDCALLPRNNPALFSVSSHMSLWSNVNFYCSLLINLIVLSFYPFTGKFFCFLPLSPFSFFLFSFFNKCSHFKNLVSLEQCQLLLFSSHQSHSFIILSFHW